ncbi:hypothetical protein BN873_720010 [Candidatus Competibacter denitrificans Run_A_D11]|uniref:Uncharacterized protein n=1 Tax=Candidatus Competibacter denitrificans Run_A_D11 TaxID=1400863 RepID=W6M7H0_9GAMM|nr:hypothetical protein BN873_720010 [Candidatus Competibacter denitrificans Run_A_D11]
MIDLYRLGAIQAPGASRQGNDLQFGLRRHRILPHGFKSETQRFQFDIRQRADFQPHPPDMVKTLLAGLAGDGFDDAFAQRKLVHELAMTGRHQAQNAIRLADQQQHPAGRDSRAAQP